MSRLPNLNAVRAFDAAARHGSFARAAEELAVSHAAVSRHVRNLEAELGVGLFERHPRHIVLTAEGSLFARTAAEALSALALGTRTLRRETRRESVILDIESDIATLWLLPLLTPEVLDALSVHLDLRVRPDPPRTFLGDVDLAIAWGAPSCAGFTSVPLIEPYPVFAVCAPALLDGGADPREPAFFERNRLIHERGLFWWRSYLGRIGSSVEAAREHLFLNRTYLCIDAALRGLGLAIGDDLVCREPLEAGRLVRLPGPPLRSRAGYHLLLPATDALPRPVRIVRDWLLEQAARSRPLEPAD